METVNTPHANRITDWLIYGTRENEKTPFEQNLEDGKKRMERLNSILKMK